MTQAQPTSGTRLAGKVAIVTGAAARGEGVGNGSAAAMLFAREGASVVVVNRTLDHAEALADTIRAAGGQARALAADVSEPEQTVAMAEFAVAHYGRIDILHNNVGTATRGNAESIDIDSWNRLFATNVTSALLSCRACIPHMRAAGGGSIINVSSYIGMLGMAGMMAYTTTKSALQGLTLAIAADYAMSGIRCNALIVGSVNTPMVAHLGPAAMEQRRLAVPLQTEGTGWDVAHAAVFLASDESRWITGAMLPIDGGFLAVRERPASYGPAGTSAPE
jgi:NAD(P)-dependent dehydrogenase (short-subunit alcohol dehydrogenase family)